MQFYKKNPIGTTSDFPEKNEFITLMCEKIGKNKNGFYCRFSLIFLVIKNKLLTNLTKIHSH